MAYAQQFVLQMAKQVGCGDSLLVMKSGCAGGRGFAPDRANSKKSFSSCQETGKIFSSEMPFYSKL